MRSNPALLSLLTKKALLTDALFGAIILDVYRYNGIYKIQWSTEADERVSDGAWCSYETLSRSLEMSSRL
jgi:hypothetical protein